MDDLEISGNAQKGQKGQKQSVKLVKKLSLFQLVVFKFIRIHIADIHPITYISMKDKYFAKILVNSQMTIPKNKTIPNYPPKIKSKKLPQN